MLDLTSHPAVALGGWLREARQSKGIVKRLFAIQIGLSPSQYSEVEVGVIRWLKESQRLAIINCLDLSDRELKHFDSLLKEARSQGALAFSNVLSREGLEPIRCRHTDDSVMEPDEFSKSVILNTVFAELV